MPVIAKITTQQNNRERYNIYFFDEQERAKYAFSVDENVLVKFSLKKGMELDELLLMEIQFADDIRKGYHIAVNYLAHRMRSEGEVREHLIKKEVDPNIVNEIIHQLYERSFLNDQEFANAYVRTAMNTTDKGPTVIQRELKEKQVAEPVIAEALGFYSHEDQVEQAVRICRKLANKNVRDSSRIMKQKLEQALFRKGYPFEVISVALEEVDTSKAEEDELSALRIQAEKHWKKYSKLPRFEGEQKLKQALYRKGFSIDDIEKVMDEFDE